MLCEFGRRKVVGVVLRTSNEPPGGVPENRLKSLLSVLDKEPALPSELLSFLEQLATYYIAPIGEVLRLALPTLERAQLEPTDEALFRDAKIATVGHLVQVAVLVDGAVPKELKGQAKGIVELLKEQGESPLTDLSRLFSNARSAVKRLVEAGLVRIEKRNKERDPFFDEALPMDSVHLLNAHQQAAVDAIVEASRSRKSTAFLLEGITGSGKTEVYLNAVAECLSRDGGAIALVPEIALTPQLVARFRARLGDRIAVLHSALSEVERSSMWRKLRSGELRVAVGARSALFAPVQNLQLICVDEEHDGSFKQEEGVRYHARDMALLRAHRCEAVCVLGSATPSLSSEALTRAGKLKRLVLPERAHAAATLPTIEVIDLRCTGPGPSGNKLLSIPLHRALEQTLLERQQAILFLNRRGFAPSIVCDACGEVARCPNCSVALTAHRAGRRRLCCHYCDYTLVSQPRCEKCGSTQLSEEGAGTERIELVLQEAFPTARIARLDRDVARGLESDTVLGRMRSGELDIMIGTQMVTKGHDLPNVTLVGVLNADAALSMPDYQAAERTFQLLVQVAGRAGRADKPGRVLIQTKNPDHPAISFARRQDHAAFVRHELTERKDARYPPYARLMMVRVDALSESLARDTIEKLARSLSARLPTGVELIGPSAAPLERLRNRFRFRFLLRSRERRPLYELAHAVMDRKVDHRVRVNVDVDPVNML